MKMWKSLLLSSLLIMGGLVASVHASSNPDHMRHDANQSHECQAESVQKPEKTSSSQSFCEVACHAAAIGQLHMAEGTAPVQPLLQERIALTHDIIVASRHTILDQPPRLS
jgi:hypothetical protein